MLSAKPAHAGIRVLSMSHEACELLIPYSQHCHGQLLLPECPAAEASFICLCLLWSLAYTLVPVQSFVSDMQRLTRRHTTMKCYGLGLGLDTFRIVSLGENFRRLDPIPLMNTYSRSVQ